MKSYIYKTIWPEDDQEIFAAKCKEILPKTIKFAIIFWDNVCMFETDKYYHKHRKLKEIYPDLPDIPKNILNIPLRIAIHE